MLSWFLCGWLIILPLAMMALCILVCVFMRRHMVSGGRTCCGYKRSGPGADTA